MRVTLGWDYDTDEHTPILSEREYREVEVRVIENPGGYYDKRISDSRWFIDQENGLVVANVEDYEKWLKTNRIDREA